MSRTSLARRERHALCDLAMEVGEEAPTLCDDWTAKDLLAHLYVRERRPWAAIGIVVPGLGTRTAREMVKVRRRPYPRLVKAVRDPGPTPYVLPTVERLVNTLEYFVHHEDLRRAQPGWRRRELEPGDEDVLWRTIVIAGRILVRPAGVPVVIARDSAPAHKVTLRRGHPPLVITGPVSELVMFLYGRSEVVGLTFEGPEEGIEALHTAGLGL